MDEGCADCPRRIFILSEVLQRKDKQIERLLKRLKRWYLEVPDLGMSIAQVWIKEAPRCPGYRLCGEPRTSRGYHQAKAAPLKRGTLLNPAILVSPINTTPTDQLGHHADATIVAIIVRIRTTEVTHQIIDLDITTPTTKLSYRSPGFLRTYPRRIPPLSLPLNTLMCMDTRNLTHRIHNCCISLTILLIRSHTYTHTRRFRLRTL